jgi:hypothetical protein
MATGDQFPLPPSVASFAIDTYPAVSSTSSSSSSPPSSSSSSSCSSYYYVCIMA